MNRIVMLLIACIMLSGCAYSVKFKNLVDYDEFSESLYVHGMSNNTFDKDDPLLKERHIALFGRVNIAGAHLICQKMAYLNDLSKDEPINLLVNSHGGSGTSYIAITNMIKSIEAPVNVINIAFAGSAAALLTQSATGKRLAMDNALFMVHDFHGSFKEVVNFYSKMQEEILKDKCKLPKGWLPFKKKDYTFTAQEALKYEFIDEVITSLPK